MRFCKSKRIFSFRFFFLFLVICTSCNSKSIYEIRSAELISRYSDLSEGALSVLSEESFDLSKSDSICIELNRLNVFLSADLNRLGLEFGLDSASVIKPKLYELDRFKDDVGMINSSNKSGFLNMVSYFFLDFIIVEFIVFLLILLLGIGATSFRPFELYQHVSGLLIVIVFGAFISIVFDPVQSFGVYQTNEDNYREFIVEFKEESFGFMEDIVSNNLDLIK